MHSLGGPTIPMSKLEWSCTDEPGWKLDDYSLKPLTPPAHRTVETDYVDYQDYALVITGDVFRWMINQAPLETLQRVRHFPRLHMQIVLDIIIFVTSDARKSSNLRSDVPRREERGC